MQTAELHHAEMRAVLNAWWDEGGWGGGGGGGGGGGPVWFKAGSHGENETR